MWWEQYGDSAPALQHCAVRIVSQVCSTLTFQRDWTIILQSHSEKRNKLNKEALADQAYNVCLPDEHRCVEELLISGITTDVEVDKQEAPLKSYHSASDIHRDRWRYHQKQEELEAD